MLCVIEQQIPSNISLVYFWCIKIISWRLAGYESKRCVDM